MGVLIPACIADANPEPMVRISVQHIAVPFETLQAMLEQDPGAKIHEEIFALRKNGGAKIIENMILSSMSGHKATCESGEDFIYPTEYDPPELKMGGGHPSPDSFGYYKHSRQNHHTTRSKIYITAWETRRLYSALEAEVEVINDNLVELRFVPEIVTLLRMKRHFKLTDRWGKMDVVFPIFESLRCHMLLRLKPGSFHLAAVNQPLHPDCAPFEKTQLLTFVRADILSP